MPPFLQCQRPATCQPTPKTCRWHASGRLSQRHRPDIIHKLATCSAFSAIPIQPNKEIRFAFPMNGSRHVIAPNRRHAFHGRDNRSRNLPSNLNSKTIITPAFAYFGSPRMSPTPNRGGLVRDLIPLLERCSRHYDFKREYAIAGGLDSERIEKLLPPKEKKVDETLLTSLKESWPQHDHSKPSRLPGRGRAAHGPDNHPYRLTSHKIICYTRYDWRCSQLAAHHGTPDIDTSVQSVANQALLHDWHRQRTGKLRSLMSCSCAIFGQALRATILQSSPNGIRDIVGA